ncbi:hypothetical protein [Jiella pelagia]|uniref:Uncharacterized protein n=1 Tax=Jiella pelagia TaxID=2986949 RepID=A0ABY7CCD3_9HYPH|nr:hypothetical protein [Jiella pelagia]WAP71390.1 hypothetical protein OH818_11755 [Jiella pelagia]
MVMPRFLDAERFPFYLVGVAAGTEVPATVAQVMIQRTRRTTCQPLRVRFTSSVTLSGLIHIVVTPNEDKVVATAAGVHPPPQRRLASALLLLPSLMSFMRADMRLGKAGVALSPAPG